MNTKKIYIKGMHCASCEKILSDEFGNISGVKKVRVSQKNNSAEIDYEGKEPDFSEVKKMAEKFGYVAFEKDFVKNNNEKEKINWTTWINSILIVGFMLVLFKIFQSTEILNKFDLNGARISFGISFLIGLAASVSSCLAVVGAVVIAFSEKYKSEGNNFYQKVMRPNLFFHAGRLGAFFFLGGLLGAVGGEINVSGNFISIFTIIIAVVMAWLGLNILGILPSISNLGIKMPQKFTKNWEKLKKSEHQAAPFLLGASSFFLPCGFTQSMQIFALTSGSFWVGGMSLFLFALGTVPTLLILGVTTSWVKNKKMEVFKKVAGFLIIFFAIYTLQSGLALRGVKTNVLSSDKKEQSGSGNSINNQNVQVVEMRVTGSGFSPNVLKIKRGVPVRWVIKGENVTSCTNKIIVPSLNISKNISYGDNVVEFTPTKAGEIPFSCWMGMVRGKFIVE